MKWDLHLSSSHTSPSSLAQTHSRATVADPETSGENRAVKFAKQQGTPWDFESDVCKCFDFFLSANEMTGEALTGRQAKNIICRHLRHLFAQRYATIQQKETRFLLQFCAMRQFCRPAIKIPNDEQRFTAFLNYLIFYRQDMHVLEKVLGLHWCSNLYLS